MNANDVIEAYVTDVALRLPRKQRNDVAFELRALLDEELQGKAAAAGRGADAAMATELVEAFGRPADVAARYRPTLTIIDPADGRAFLRAAVIGLAVIWGLGLLQVLGQPIASGWDLLTVLGRAWGSVLGTSLSWLGLLVACYGTSAWGRRRWPQGAEWKPGASDRIEGGRATLVLGLLGILCGLYVLVEPRWILDFFWAGRAAPAAYEALTYTETFRGRQAPWLFALIALNIPLLVVVMVQGRWTATTRRIEHWGALATCAVMAWTILDGPVLVGAAGDRMARSIMGLIIAAVLLGMGIKRLRSVRPAPQRQVRT